MMGHRMVHDEAWDENADELGDESDTLEYSEQKSDCPLFSDVGDQFTLWTPRQLRFSYVYTPFCHRSQMGLFGEQNRPQ